MSHCAVCLLQNPLTVYNAIMCLLNCYNKWFSFCSNFGCDFMLKKILTNDSFKFQRYVVIIEEKKQQRDKLKTLSLKKYCFIIFEEVVFM